ncbi:MAG: exodeoxyribonuclease VII large subunit [Bacteroidales bacterium]|nr:exodeoxyribonuclease VII large subunit [Bacteroidales bacterium]
MDLYELQVILKQGVTRLFPEAVWVKAEIASIGVRTNGHCYMELSQSEGGVIVAKTRAAAWKYNWIVISRAFKAATGEDLKAGQEVLVKVRVTAHEVYGITLSVEDINPEFTVGARQMQKKQTIERLEKEGLMDLQKELALPDLPYWLAVISAPDAAGLGDFRRHLLENEMGYAFSVDLFEATMQGAGAPESICAALGEIEGSKVSYDAVLILRGGGSELDLACFDDYDLAAAIARFPVPVFTAIGHDRDHHVADMVAHLYVKTPTALADLFLDCFAAEDERIAALQTRLQVAFTSRVAACAQRLDKAENAIASGMKRRLDDASHLVERYSDSVLRSLSNRFAREDDRLSVALSGISRAALSRVLRAEDKLHSKEDFIVKMALNKVERAVIKLGALDMQISSSDPRKVLERGIPVVEDRSGRKDAPASSFRPGDPVKVWLKDGSLDCVVQKVSLSEPEDISKTA